MLLQKTKVFTGRDMGSSKSLGPLQTCRVHEKVRGAMLVKEIRGTDKHETMARLKKRSIFVALRAS